MNLTAPVRCVTGACDYVARLALLTASDFMRWMCQVFHRMPVRKKWTFSGHPKKNNWNPFTLACKKEKTIREVF